MRELHPELQYFQSTSERFKEAGRDALVAFQYTSHPYHVKSFIWSRSRKCDDPP